MPELDGPQKALLRTHPHKIKLYLAVLAPEPAYTAQVDDGDIEKGERVIRFDNGDGLVSDIQNGMSLWVGSDPGQQDKGRVRIKSASDEGGGTGTITVAENEHIDWKDDDDLTVNPVYEFWPVYPRITNTEGLDHFKDYDIDYDPAVAKQNELLNPVPIMGPPACAFIDPVTGLATVYVTGQDSYCLGSSILWGEGNSEWLFPGGTPGQSNAPAPGNVTWDTPGIYTMQLAAVADNGKTTTGYRHVFIFERTGVNAPYTNFTVQSARCSRKDGGWSHSYAVHGDADASKFPDGAMVVLFAEAYYGSTLKNFGMNYPGRHNIRAVGWIVDESVKKAPETGEVTFDTQGIAGLMKSRENFMCGLDYVSGAPTEWTELKDMDTDRALFHYLYWHSTIFKMTDVRVSGQIHPAPPGPFLVAIQDFARGSLWEGLSKLCEEAFLVPTADRASCLYLDYDPQMLDEDDWPAVQTVMLLAHIDRAGELALTRRLEKQTNFVDFEGMAFDGTTARPVISYAPGRAPEYSGRPRPSKRHVLDPAGDWQAKANAKAGLRLARDNNEFPEIRWPAAGDYSVTDIAPQEVFTLDLIAGDTKRGIVWDTQRLIIAAINEKYDVANGVCQTQFTFEKQSLGPPGVTGDYPEEEPPPPPPVPPDPPDPPEPEPGGWRKKIYAATNDLGIFYTEDFSGPGGGQPTWGTVNDGLGVLTTRGIVGDPWNPSYRQYTRTMEHKIYRREAEGLWSVVLDQTIVQSVTGITILGGTFRLTGPECNINAQGHVYVLAYFLQQSDARRFLYFFKSVDHGDNWAAYLIVSYTTTTPIPFLLRVGAFKGSSPYAAGQVIYAMAIGDIFGDWGLWVSVDQGGTWSGPVILGHCEPSGMGGDLARSPADQDIIYWVGWGTDLGGYAYNLRKSINRGGSWATLWGCAWHPCITQRPGIDIWKPNSAYMAAGVQGLNWTEDDWANWVTHTNTDGFLVDGCSRVMDSPELLYGSRGGNPTAGQMQHVITVSVDRGDNWEGKAGTNCATPPYTGAIPNNCGGISGILQIWTED